MTAVDAVQPHLTTVTGEIMPLKSLAVSGDIADNLAVLELSQVYSNRESTNIEAIYTFPLPFDGVLLGLQATLGDKVLEGTVMPKQQAEDRYEDAITDGNSAIMLEQQSPGLYTVNLGNLMPGEDAVIKIRYALPLKWTGKQLRIMLPLTVAPRYGIPDFGDQRPFAVPEQDFIIEYPLSVALSITGALAACPIVSPTHTISARSEGEVMEIGLHAGVDHPDRDLVLLLEKPDISPNTLSSVQVDDCNYSHAVFCIPEIASNGPLASKVLIDCSGSMSGDSMNIAKNAIERLAQYSKAGDQLSLTAFGSSFTHYDGGSFQTITEAGLPIKAVGWLRGLEADLGGTEMESALRSVFSLSGSETPANVLMITDGEIWDINGVITASRNAGQRVFVIGVGLSPAESNLRALAEATGGFVEFLSPGEPVNSVVDRQLNRMRQPSLSNARFETAGELQWIVPNPVNTPFYAGDTVHFWYETQGNTSTEQAILSVYTENGEPLTLNAHVTANQGDLELPRLATAAQLKSWDLKNAVAADRTRYTELAVTHQLVTPLTNFLMIHECHEEDSADELPVTRQVNHMGRPSILRSKGSPISESFGDADICESSGDFYDVPAFLRRQDKTFFETRVVSFGSEADSLDFDNHSDLINLYFEARGSLPLTIHDLSEGYGLELDPDIAAILRELVFLKVPEDSALLSFWHAIRKTPLKRGLSRKVVWWIKHQRKLTDQEKALSLIMTAALAKSDKAYLRWSDATTSDQLIDVWGGQ